MHAKLAALQERLEGIAAQIPQLSRATHRSGSTSQHGHLGNIRGTLPIVEKELQECQSELATAHAEVLGIMNDPTRTSTEPTGGLAELLELGADVLAKIIARWKKS
jgi:hypothetical protein